MTYLFQLVVIHGVTDGALSSEGPSPTRYFFSAEFPSASIVEFQFPNVPFNHSLTSTDLKQQARLVNKALLAKRSDEDNENDAHSPLVFMGHDLGGCLIKQMLLLATEELEFRPIRSRVKGIIFIGTPHRGADVAFWEHHVIRLLAFSELECGSPSQLLQSLPQQLCVSADDFAQISWDFEMVNIFQREEARGDTPTANHGTVLYETFAILDSQKAKNVGLGRSHAKLWEFKLGDSKTEMVCKELNNMFDGEKPVTQGRLQDFLEVLSQLDPKTSRLGTARPAPNSIDWVLSDKSYQDWRSGSDTGILHVFGPAGSGTTVLATHILKLALEARSYRQAAILSYSFDKDDIQARGQRNAFASLSRQLLLARPGLFHHVRPLCDFMLKQKLFNKHILWSLLSSLLIHCTASAVYCIIHAVHECEESLAEVIHALSKIVHASGGFIKMILTSDDIFASGHMQPCPCVSGTCRSITSGGERHTMIAVEALVRENVARMVREKRPWAEFEDIVRTLCKPPTSHLSAMYALALLESSDIRSTEEEIRTKLKELRLVGTESLGRPSDRHDYESWVVSTFRWMRHAVRLLTIAELAVAVAFDEFLSKRGNRTLYDIGQASLPDLEMLAKLIPRDIIGDLTRRAGPLIKVDGNRVVPVHRSLRELLYDEADSGEKPSHPCYSILTTCLEYLKYASLRHGLASYNLEEQSEFENALLNYAVAYWPDHYELVSQEFRGYANKLVDSFLGDESCLSFWTERYGKTERVLFVDLHLHSSPRIQAISLLGHREHLIGAIREAEVIPSTSEKQDQLQDALNQAARFGQLELVRVLLDSGAKSGRALGLAAAGGHRDVVSALLEANPAAITWEEEKSRYTALHHAVCSGDLTTVEILVKRDDVALNAQTSDGASALCLASETGQTPIFSMLIDRDADMNLEDEDGNDALKLAARGGFSEMVRILLDRRIDPNKPGSKGDTAVHLATQIGHPITLKHLVQADADVKCTNREGLTPLHIAAAQGHLEILKMLLGAQQPRSGPISRHLDDNEEKARQRPLVLTYKFPAPPLQQAAMTGRVDIVQALLEDQAGHSMEDCCRAMFVATRYGLFEVTKKLLDHGSITEARDECGETLLHQAVEGRDTNVLEILLKRTSEMTNVNTRNQLGWTALHNAAYIGSLALVKLLLENKADVNARTNDEETPLHFAAREGHRLVAQALLEGMTDIEKKNSKGETPFMLAVERRHVKTVQDLLRSKKGLDFPFHSTAILQQETVLKALLACGNEWDCSKPDEMQSRNTPLHLAVQLELTRAVELLHEAGADLNARNEDDETPLFLAALTGNVEILRLLLASGADVDTPDSSGRTPLYAASLEGHVETVRALLENDPKPDVNYANARGWVPLHAASEEADITKLLLDEGADPRRGTRFSGMIPFARACFTDRRLPVVRCYLEDPANADLPNIPDNGGETAVHRSAVGGSVRVMKELIQHKAKLDVQRKDGSTPLHIAISTVETSIANLLLDKDVDVSKHNEKDGTVLMVAAAAGQVEIADRLHCKSVDVNEICEPYYTALNAAAYFGRLRMIQWLLRHGADPNLAGGRHGSPLSAALEGGSGDVAAIVSELVEGGHANVNYVTKNGVSVLRMAVDQGLTDVVRILVRHGAGTDGEKPARQPVVLEAVQAGQISILDDLLKDPPNLLVRDKFGRSLLSVAIVTRRHRVVEWLLDRADSMDVAINSGDHAGRTPLILCVLKRNANLAKLLSKGPDIDATDCEGKTALAYACILDVKSSVNSLLAAGASPLLPDYRNRGPLYWACRRSSIEVVQKVLQTLRDKTGRDDRYRTECAAAISAAIASNRPSFMEVLLKEKPLSTSHVAGDGWTPFYTAERYGLASMTEMLVAAGFIDQNPSNQLRPKLDNLASAPPVDAGSAGQPRVVDSKLQRNMMGVTQLDLIQPPSSWSTEDKTPCLIVDETMITVGDDRLTPGDDWPHEMQATVRANFPMTPIKELGNVYYFEVTIEKNEKPNHWSVGFCEEHARLNLALGWDGRSWGWHGDDSDKFAEGVYNRFDEPYGEGNIIGCGVDFDDGSAFFTRNAVIVGQAFKGIRGKLYPAVSVNQGMKGAKLSAKFWRGSKDDFTFKKFGDPRTREPPVGLIKMNKEATEEDIDLVTVGNDGQAEVDIPLQIAS